MCKTAGNACASNADCCNGTCVTIATDGGTPTGQCAAPSQVSYCVQVGDICTHDSDCCTGVCTLGVGLTVGTCTAINTSCAVDGTACNGCSGCCSSFCAPFGTSGSKICQPASGCHVTGDLCHQNSDCCGGDPTQIGVIPGAGLIVCTPDANHPQIGVCSTPDPNNCPNGHTCGSACVPEGDICHYLGNGGCSSNSIRNDCCQATGNKGQCKLDKLGIPRCYGLTACVPMGGACASSADCCNGIPCVPDANGHLICANTTCVPAGGVCTTTSDCCTGLPCIVPTGSLQGTCGIPNVTPPDMGTPMDLTGAPVPDLTGAPLPDLSGAPPPDMAAPQCALYGQSCSTTVPCCGLTTCLAPYPTSTPCAAGETDCTCYTPIM
jgi:hypothetical protein